MPNIYDIPSPYLELLAALIGVCVGSFLNVVAVRSLAEKSSIASRLSLPAVSTQIGLERSHSHFFVLASERQVPLLSGCHSLALPISRAADGQ
jgi:prepilin signal peptidase PulO-like enzyme (type II secretory pathway)